MIYIILSIISPAITFLCGYLLGKKYSPKKIKLENKDFQLDLLEKAIYNLQACADNLIMHPEKERFQKDYMRVRDITSKLVSQVNKKSL